MLLGRAVSAPILGIIGQSVTFNNQSHTVVGVMPANFQFPVGFGYIGKSTE